MSETAPKTELMRSLGRLVRGLSALFWGLPIALVACVQSATTDCLHFAERSVARLYAGVSRALLPARANPQPPLFHGTSPANTATTQPMAPAAFDPPARGDHHVADLENKGSHTRQRVRAGALIVR